MVDERRASEMGSVLHSSPRWRRRRRPTAQVELATNRGPQAHLKASTARSDAVVGFQLAKVRLAVADKS